MEHGLDGPLSEWAVLLYVLTRTRSRMKDIPYCYRAPLRHTSKPICVHSIGIPHIPITEMLKRAVLGGNVVADPNYFKFARVKKR